MTTITTAPPVQDHRALRFLTAGSVDDGKSTLIGRLLYDSRAILADQLDTLEKRAAGSPIDLSLLTDVTPPLPGEAIETAEVRFRTVGDMTCTCPVESLAATPAEIVAETLQVTVSERGATRMDDRTSEASMERRKKEGYF